MRRLNASLPPTAALLRSRLLSRCKDHTPRRPFTSHYPRLLLTTKHSLRPQLSYLGQPSFSSSGPLIQRRIARLLTTENKRYVKEQTWLAIKWNAVAWTMILLLGCAAFAWRSEKIERVRPSPPDWSYMTRKSFRSAWLTAAGYVIDMLAPEWGQVGNHLRLTLHRLESAECDGAELRQLAAIGVEAYDTVRGIGPKCFDCSAKSEAWRAGYVDVVMTLAQISERLQGYVYDAKQGTFFPQSVVIGPSNPRPRKLPPPQIAPNEEDCYPAYPSPVVFYNRIANGLGFSAKQRIAAMHAHASWLEFQGDKAGAEEQYEYAIAVASDAANNTGKATDSVDEVGKLDSQPGLLTLNLLDAFTQQAAFLVRLGRTAEALPTFLSCLRAIRSTGAASGLPASNSVTAPATTQSRQRGPLAWLDRNFKFREDVYPLPPHTGNEPICSLARSELACPEAELMLYTGEILFASNRSKRAEGLEWTKSASREAAEAIRAVKMAWETRALDEQRGTALLEGDARKKGRELHERAVVAKCRQCLATSLRNWEDMSFLMLEAAERETSQQDSGWTSWLAGGAGGAEAAVDKCKAEVRAVTEVRAGVIADELISKHALAAD